MDYSKIRGFNYQPSYGRTGDEIWRNFSSKVVADELQRGKKYFPGMNAVRFWLSWSAFTHAGEDGRKAFCRNFETMLRIADDLGVKTMPTLTNRWHVPYLDYGGIYIDHFVPGLTLASRGFREQTKIFLDAIVGAHVDDHRVFLWDLCNEPFHYLSRADGLPEIERAEKDWLYLLYSHCKELKAEAPLTIGIHPNTALERVDHIADVLSIHPYWIPGDDKSEFEKKLDREVAFAERVGKPLLAGETCWGGLDDAERVAVMRYTFGALKDRGIGFLAYLLNHSLIADGHRPEYGPISDGCYLAFIEADGSLRKGHEAFNEF